MWKIKIPDISNLATKILVNEVENRIPDISNLATKIALTTVQNKIPDISSLVKKIDYNMEITDIELRINKLQAYDLIVNIYIFYELAASSSHTSDSTIKNCLFGAVTLTKTVDIENTNVQVMELDLIEDQVFHSQVMDLVKMY